MSAAEPVTDPTVREYDLVVSLGTDHHPFDRLLDWCEDYALARPGTRCHIQHGFTKAPQRCTGVERMPREQLLETYRGAAAVLVQGGPGSILDAREAGIVPVAVPRRQDLGEVVDDHQIQFTRIMAEQGEASWPPPGRSCSTPWTGPWPSPRPSARPRACPTRSRPPASWRTR
ncbi:hypothetical protein [Rothia kristinae]|uniref:hypothetical protein n=1 Tax=Rothia kristinae TaxID=37923 RepID=UPI0018CB4D45|nr:hypothetical protein [Rothia kristinae]